MRKREEMPLLSLGELSLFRREWSRLSKLCPVGLGVRAIVSLIDGGESGAALASATGVGEDGLLESDEVSMSLGCDFRRGVVDEEPLFVLRRLEAGASG